MGYLPDLAKIVGKERLGYEGDCGLSRHLVLCETYLTADSDTTVCVVCNGCVHIGALFLVHKVEARTIEESTAVDHRVTEQSQDPQDAAVSFTVRVRNRLKDQLKVPA